MSVVPTARVDPKPTLYENLKPHVERWRARVSDAAAQAGSNGWAHAAPNPWIIAVLVALAAFMEVLDTSIANVVLPYIARRHGRQLRRSVLGGDQLSGSTISLTASPFLSPPVRPQDLLPDLPRALQRQLDHARPDPNSLLLFRILQGLRGRRHGAGIAVDFGRRLPAAKARPSVCAVRVAVVVAPVGPTLGGWLADNFTWRWCFLIACRTDI